jgi:hypothetical protein
MIAGGDALDDGHNAPPHVLQQRRDDRVVCQQSEQRWLVRDDSAQQRAMLAREPQRDRRTERVAGDPGRCQPEVLQQGRKVCHILKHTPLPVGTLALAVSAPVVGQDAEGS